MLAQECPIMHPTKNKSETKFGQHALTIRYYSTAIYIYIYIYIYIVVGYAVTMT